jgi:hypothetical protein
MTIPMQFGAIENREGPEDSRMGEGRKNHTLEHRCDPRDLAQVVVSLRDDNYRVSCVRTVRCYGVQIELDDVGVSDGHR